MSEDTRDRDSRCWDLAGQLLNSDAVTEEERVFIARFISWSYLDMPVTEAELARVEAIHARVTP